MSGKSFSFLIVAGGSGSRIGGTEKQFRLIGGRPLWRWSADLAAAAREIGIEEIVLVLPKAHEALSDPNETPPMDLSPLGIPFTTVSGGETRTDSVRNGLEKCSCDYVMVHDAARPFASVKLLAALAERTAPTAGAIPVLPVAEAVKRVADGRVQAVDRDGLYLTQTPQSFYREALVNALAMEGSSMFKDEAEAWLAAGLDLNCIDGERLNFKVTWPEDLMLAEAVAARGEALGSEIRTGIGWDVHRLTPERPLVLGGVAVPSPLGLLGHSDADVLAHAVADAVLGAAGLPDIGNLFPASDERYKNADSMKLLNQAVELAREARWEVVWLDAVIEAQVPRLNGYLPSMKENISKILRPDGKPCVSLKAKSAEKTDDPGRGRSMTCQAVATLRRMV